MLKELVKYSWPGNIRELENVLERAVIVCNSDTIKVRDLSPIISEDKKRTTDLKDKMLTLEEIERDHIVKALLSTNWQIHGAGGAAEILGINPSTLRSRMKKLNINRPV